MTDRERLLDALYDHILNGEAESSVAHTQEGLELGIEPTSLLYDAMIPALEEVGSLFEAGTYFIPEMLISARAMQASMDLLRPHLVGTGQQTIGTFLIGTVAGDIHDIGKNMCGVMLEGAGFEVIDLGVNVPGDRFVSAIREHRPDIVGMSAFLTTTMPEIPRNLELLEGAGVRHSVRVMVGGAPVDQQYATEVGADGYAPDASSATRAAKKLLDQD